MLPKSKKIFQLGRFLDSSIRFLMDVLKFSGISVPQLGQRGLSKLAAIIWYFPLHFPQPIIIIFTTPRFLSFSTKMWQILLHKKGIQNPDGF